MSLATLYSSHALFRATTKTLVFGLSSFAAIFCASAGYGLLKMLLLRSDGAAVGIAELASHAALTIAFFLLAGIGAYVAKKCFW